VYFEPEPQKVKKRQCRAKPGCINELKIRGRAHQICDSVIDCKDRSDELSCDYCTAGSTEKNLAQSSEVFFCGNGQCIDQSKRCDSVIDCINGQDEIDCLQLYDDINYRIDQVDTQNRTTYRSKGYLFATHRGEHGKVCASSFLNITIPALDNANTLESIGIIVCRYLGFT
jgi:PREDICTED: similar to vitellogenin receptor, partial